MQIGKNTIVALRYIMYNGRGEMLENKMASSPVNYLHGSSGILLLLQQQLEGLEEGDKKEIILSGNADMDDEFRFDVVIDHVRAAMDEEVMLGYPLQTYNEICDDDCNCYDVKEE